ncbi:respiratory supercomplex factor 2, mitochondrial [[Candida] jaroonii]|uniref:Respiratory supercomplex factor 2, mitochondrial n=1 Tax=[Candida] jaroonii TaxID=467808 RepID=A0ACA9Y801_9ASCO|nr:respiratory supercomplex factor 2, mitochondrial [[Candida] jaroonii]
MKIVDQEEKDAHLNHIIGEGAKGLFYGSLISCGLFGYLKYRQPVRFRQFNASIKTALFVMPSISMAAFFADQGGVQFDRSLHTSEYENNKIMEEYRVWNNLSTSDKFFHSLNEHKYKIIIGTWVGSLYGSWVIVNRDKIMTVTQKAVQARMYAQGITIILLLGTILLSMKEAEILKKQPKAVPEWQKILQEKEAEAKQKIALEKKIKAQRAQNLADN